MTEKVIQDLISLRLRECETPRNVDALRAARDFYEANIARNYILKSEANKEIETLRAVINKLTNMESCVDGLNKKEWDEIQGRLLPCPHCGSLSTDTEKKRAAVFFGGGPRIPKFYKVQCYRCNASVEQGSIEGAVLVWNTRA